MWGRPVIYQRDGEIMGDDFVKKSRSTQGLRSNPDSRIA